MSLLLDVALTKIVPDGCCTYCHRAFGSQVTWRNEARWLEEVREHVIPKVLGGKITVPACQICNEIKGSLRFDTLAEIQSYCLDQLLKNRSILLESVRYIFIERAVRMESVTDTEVTEFEEKIAPTVELPTCAHCGKAIRYGNGYYCGVSCIRKQRAQSVKPRKGEKTVEPKKWTGRRNWRRREVIPAPNTLCRARRRELNLSQQGLAELAKIQQPYISMVERGLPINPADMSAIANVLGVEAQELLIIVEESHAS